MSRSKEELRTDGVSLLGSKNTKYNFEYDPSVLETFENKNKENDYFVKFNCPEFTSMCPVTHQPDAGTAYINYIPGDRMVESKSLKLYLFSYRNYGCFHEDICNTIMKDLVVLMHPKYIEVTMKFLPRGGLSIFPYANYANDEEKYQKMRDYRMINHDMYLENINNL